MKKVFEVHLHYCSQADRCCAGNAAGFVSVAPSSLHRLCNAILGFLLGKSLTDLQGAYTWLYEQVQKAVQGMPTEG